MSGDTVLVICTFSVNIPHFETELEIIQRHLDDGDTVHATYCQKHFLSCDVNPYHEHHICFKCEGRAENGLRSFSDQIKVISQNDFWSEEARANLSELRYEFKTTDEMRNYFVTYEGVRYDIGEAVLSTVISTYRDPSENVLNHKKMIRDLMHSSYFQFVTICKMISARNYNKVYMFNGRFSVTRSAMRICQQKNIDIYLHERGCNEYRYALFKNDLAQSLSLRKQMIDELWESTDQKEREEIGNLFYTERKQGIQQSWKSYTDQQDTTRLPDGFDSNKTNIVIFGSSEDEYAAVGDEYKNPVYIDQHDGVNKILKDLSSIEGISKKVHVYLRMHPGLSGSDSSFIKQMESIKADFFTYIPPESKISSYLLLDSADRVISFGSTVGIEASYWKRPSIAIGRSFFEDLGATYHPKSHKEVMGLILSESLAVLGGNGTLKYGLYEKRYGNEFKYFTPNGLFDGRYRGKKIRPSFLDKLYKKFFLPVSSIKSYFDNESYEETRKRFYT